MTDLSQTIAPKSDQLNADDLISGPRTIRVTRVSANPSSAEQPVSVFFEGDGNKPFKPCKSMRRVMVHVWGPDGNQYAGRSMTLFRDPEVTWGGMKVGGIRISHMSNIDKPVSMALTANKKQRKPYKVEPLQGGSTGNQRDNAVVLAELEVAADNGLDALKAAWEALSPDERKAMQSSLDGLKQRANNPPQQTADDHQISQSQETDPFADNDDPFA